MRKYIIKVHSKSFGRVVYRLYERRFSGVDTTFTLQNHDARAGLADVVKSAIRYKKGVDFNGNVHDENDNLIGAIVGTEFRGINRLKHDFVKKQPDPQPNKYEEMALELGPDFLFG